MDIISYLNSKDILIDKNKFENIQYEINIDKQIQLICNIQKELIGETETIIPRIQSEIGKEIDYYKVEIKKNKNYLKTIKDSILDSDKIIKDYGTAIVNEAEEISSSLDIETYYHLIRRSMKRRELCLGRVDEGNLIKSQDGNIYIRTSKYISYNLFENDFYNYVKKLRKRIAIENIENIIKTFVNESKLDEKSFVYLDVLVRYPFEEMKLLSKCRENKLKSVNEEELMNAFKKVKEIDKNGLL